MADYATGGGPPRHNPAASGRAAGTTRYTTQRLDAVEKCLKPGYYKLVSKKEDQLEVAELKRRIQRLREELVDERERNAAESQRMRIALDEEGEVFERTVREQRGKLRKISGECRLLEQQLRRLQDERHREMDVLEMRRQRGDDVPARARERIEELKISLTEAKAAREQCGQERAQELEEIARVKNTVRQLTQRTKQLITSTGEDIRQAWAGVKRVESEMARDEEFFRQMMADITKALDRTRDVEQNRAIREQAQVQAAAQVVHAQAQAQALANPPPASAVPLLSALGLLHVPGAGGGVGAGPPSPLGGASLGLAGVGGGGFPPHPRAVSPHRVDLQQAPPPAPGQQLYQLLPNGQFAPVAAQTQLADPSPPSPRSQVSAPVSLHTHPVGSTAGGAVQGAVLPPVLAPADPAATTADANVVEFTKQPHEIMGCTWDNVTLALEHVVPGSAAERAGASRFLGRRLQGVNSQAVSGIGDIRGAMGDGVMVKLRFY